MKKSIFFLLTLLSFTYPGCSNKTNPGNDTTSSAAKQTSTVAEVTSVERRDGKAPNFSWQDSGGKKIDFTSVSGKLTLINFWATWCGPCKHEMPDLIALNKEYESRGLTIIGISADVGSSAIEDVKSFVQEQGIPYRVLLANEDIKEAFGNVNMLPTSFLIDKDGKILETLIGARSKASFAQVIDKHL
ncbi:MAG: redoxin domain-containing protein [Bacteroidota bacterium]